MSMKDFIKVLELHFSNKCTGRCRICSKVHGGDNPPFVTEEVIEAIIKNLEPGPDQIKTKVIQTGGDGDSFLNPLYLPSLREIKKRVPNAYTCLYSNFSLVLPYITDNIIRENLLDEIHVRIDSLDPEIYHWSTGLRLERTLSNIRYFMKKNRRIKFGIIYFPLYKYEEVCGKILNKYPLYFDHEIETFRYRLKDEESKVRHFFGSLDGRVEFMRSGICLWGEREFCEVPKNPVPCTRLPENDGAFENLLLIYPNGKCGMCAYSDDQDTFILGNVLEEKLKDIWNSDKRQKFITRIRNNEFVGRYPCVNPAACYFYNV